MKKEKQKLKKFKGKKISRVLVRNSLIVLSILILIFTFIVTVSILAFETGMFLTKGPNPHNKLGLYLMFVLAIFAIVFFVVYAQNKKVISIMKKLEEATDEVSKGNFKIQVELTEDENINSYIINFNKMVRELSSMETLQEDFISNVSHEFKTPISVIQSYSKALRHTDLDEKTRKEYEEILDANIKKLTTLTSNILSLAKLENQEIVLKKKEFLLDEQIRQCVVGFQPEWTKKNINFNLDLPKTAYFGSEELISQVWQNLISNAIKFSNKDGEISISIKQEEKNILVSVEDNGIGMTKETLQKIFDKFYQGDTSHSSEGNGLGLALVKRILKICDGEINVSSEKDKGTKFIVALQISQKN